MSCLSSPPIPIVQGQQGCIPFMTSILVDHTTVLIAISVYLCLSFSFPSVYINIALSISLRSSESLRVCQIVLLNVSLLVGLFVYLSFCRFVISLARSTGKFLKRIISPKLFHRLRLCLLYLLMELD